MYFAAVTIKRNKKLSISPCSNPGTRVEISLHSFLGMSWHFSTGVDVVA